MGDQRRELAVGDRVQVRQAGSDAVRPGEVVAITAGGDLVVDVGGAVYTVPASGKASRTGWSLARLADDVLAALRRATAATVLVNELHDIVQIGPSPWSEEQVERLRALVEHVRGEVAALREVSRG